MKVKYHRISEVDLEAHHKNLADPEVMTSDPLAAAHNYSFTTLRPYPEAPRLYLGTTNMKNRIFWSFDPATGHFDDLGYDKAADPFEIKIHRSLEYDQLKQIFYGVSSGLHNESLFLQAPGARIFQYAPLTRQYEFLGIPLPHEYTQTITFDPGRRLLYGFTYHTFSFYVFDVDKRQTIFSAMPGSISHISAIDDTGCIWSTWGRDLHYIYKYDPAKNDIEWTKKMFPEGGKSYMYPGAGPIDCMVNGKDGFLYVALETGTLLRFDPKRMEFEYLGRPSPYPRMPALILAEDGLFYGTCGDNWNVKVFVFNRKTRGFSIIGDVAEGKTRCYRPHDIAMIHGRIYVGETDNPKRSGYLWEIIP